MIIYRILLGCLLTGIIGAGFNCVSAEKTRRAANVKLHGLFTDNMVLQRGQSINVKGFADPRGVVLVELNGQKSLADVNENGKWHVKLKPMNAGGPFNLIVKGAQTITLKNVMIGDVWVCSGQSNMTLPVRRALEPVKEISAADYPDIRLFTVEKNADGALLEDIKGEWQACSPKTVGEFSAVGYFFGREIHKHLKVPIGLIHSSVSGTQAEEWTRLEALGADKDFWPILKRYGNIDECLDGDTFNTEKIRPYPAHNKPGVKQARTSEYYNAMIHPLTPFAVKGVIWYQGEGNIARAYQYRKLLPALITDWRKNWGWGDFPFLIVQIAANEDPKPLPVESAGAEMREAQVMALKLPATGLAVSIDIGSNKDSGHPRNKQGVGRRLALAARHVAYGEDLVYSGPMYKSMRKEKSGIRIYFTHIGGGLVSKGGGLKQFTIAGKDRKFVWADARIEGDTVFVWDKKVPDPVAVRYAWASDPVGCNLFNEAALPAILFRTDNWPGETINRR